MKTSLTLVLLLSVPSFARPADAPLREPEPPSLTPQWFEQEYAQSQRLDRGGAALRGVAITSAVVGGLGLMGYCIGATINAFNAIASDLGDSLSSAFGRSARSSTRAEGINLTPLLVTAIVGPVLGLVTGISGVALSTVASARHEELDFLQASALRQAQSAFWARMDEEAARVGPAPTEQPAVASVPAVPSAPPAPPDVDAPRKPLVPR